LSSAQHVLLSHIPSIAVVDVLISSGKLIEGSLAFDEPSIMIDL